MSYLAAGLIITSAFMHAFWNFISKRRSPSLAFFFVTVAAAALIVSPLLIFYRHTLPFVPRSVWLLVLATGVAQLLYFSGLSGAYRRGDISFAYPLARATPVLLIAGITLTLGAGGRIGPLGLAGMLLITAGCVMLPMRRFEGGQLRHYFDVVTLMALLAALGTTGYTLLDDQALRQLRFSADIQLSSLEVTLLFISLQTLSTTLMLGMAVLLYRPERRRLREHLRSRSLLLSGALTGLVIMTTYGLVLASMAYVSNVSYVAAFRQLSIPIGAAMGIALLKEPRYPPKLVGIGVVTLGLLLVGFG